MKNAGVRDVRGYNRKVERENAEIEAEVAYVRRLKLLSNQPKME